jgi:hypothetical protein
VATQLCTDEKPALRDVGGEHLVACHFPGQSDVLVQSALHDGEPRAGMEGMPC